MIPPYILVMVMWSRTCWSSHRTCCRWSSLWFSFFTVSCMHTEHPLVAGACDCCGMALHCSTPSPSKTNTTGATMRTLNISMWSWCVAPRHYSVRQTASETMKVSGVQVISLSFITDNVIMTESHWNSGAGTQIILISSCSVLFSTMFSNI